MTDKELLQMALEWVEWFASDDHSVRPTSKARETAEAIKARLAQPEPEPVAWMYEFGTDNADAVNDVRWYKNVSLTKPHGMVRDVVSLYTTPPKKEWVGLTDEEIKDAWSQLWHDLNNGKFAATDDPSRHTNVMFARALEAKLKEKNNAT